MLAHVQVLALDLVLILQALLPCAGAGMVQVLSLDRRFGFAASAAVLMPALVLDPSIVLRALRTCQRWCWGGRSWCRAGAGAGADIMTGVTSCHP